MIPHPYKRYEILTILPGSPKYTTCLANLTGKDNLAKEKSNNITLQITSVKFPWPGIRI
jgi:hypothetical protein